ncbi:ParA family protein [Actinopolymorpha sp. B9G3]|uniref:ParA family protein n=1 Tax=Actinopolymorpha sp. B9G3 TaxID=3158970 RepID=UPI0032D8BAD4
MTTGLGWPLDWPSTTEEQDAEETRPRRQAVGGLGWPVEGPAGLGWSAEVGTGEGSARSTSTAVVEDEGREGGTPGTSALSADLDAIPQVSSTVEMSTEEPADLGATNAAAATVSRETPEDAEPPPTAGLQSNVPVVFSPTLPRPVQTRVFVVANQKGGVGKTTTAVNLAAALAGSGARVLVVDLDPQGNASTALGIDHTEGVPNIYDVIVEGEPMRNFVYPVHRFPTLFGVPATIDLSGAELELASVVAREARLKKFLDAYLDEQAAAGERYDYVLIDCPPSLGLLTMNALVAGREVLVPIQCEYYALEGVETLFRIVNLVRELNRSLQVTTVILTMYDARTRLSAQVAENARESLGHTVLRSAIPRSVRISEAPSFGQTVMTWDAGSPGALSYLEAARELALRDPAAPAAAGANRSIAAPDVVRQEVLGSATATGVDRGDLR